MGAIAAAAAIAIGAGVAGGMGAASASSAGKAAINAGKQASLEYARSGKEAASILDEAQGVALGKLDPYRLKLDNLPWELAKSVQGNQQLMGAIRPLAKSVNNFNQNELNRLLRVALPGEKDMVQLASNNTLSMLRGEIPADVAAQIRRTTAGSALRGGFAGSESSAALTARDLGSTSLNLMQEGSNSAQRWIQTARTSLMPALFDPTSQFATPQLTLQSILGAAGIAKDQADIITGTATKKAGLLTSQNNLATGAELDAQAALIKARQAESKAISDGIQGILGAAGGAMGGGGGTGMNMAGMFGGGSKPGGTGGTYMSGPT